MHWPYLGFCAFRLLRMWRCTGWRGLLTVYRFRISFYLKMPMIGTRLMSAWFRGVCYSDFASRNVICVVKIGQD